MTIEADLLSSAKRAMFTKALRNAVCVWGGCLIKKARDLKFIDKFKKPQNIVVRKLRSTHFYVGKSTYTRKYEIVKGN